MANLFRSVPLLKPRKNFFDLSHEVKTSCRMGELIPFFCEPTVPGDKFKMQTEILVRLAPTLAPVMHRVNVYTHFFAVPYRLIWNQWEEFITKGVNGSVTPEYPTIQACRCFSGPNSLASHLGFPVQDVPFSPNGTNVNENIANQACWDALPFRAYQLIYDEYYRDQNLQAPIFKHIADRDGVPDGTTSPNVLIGSGFLQSSANNWQLSELTAIRHRAWEKDYFTSALPWSQRGDDVSIGFGGDLDIKYKSPSVPQGNKWVQPTASGDLPLAAGVLGTNAQGQTIWKQNSNPGATTGSVARLDTSDLYADGAGAATTITELRRGMKLQEFLEKNARGGSRYIESILSHFGVKSSDARLQRPIYLGGGISPIVISEVVQTAQDAENPVGTMRGHAISAQVTHQFKHFFEEHCLILGILSIMPKPAYMNGTPRKYLKRDVFDFYWPEFANIGEQAIMEQEIYTDWSKASAGSAISSDDDQTTDSNLQTFGYAPRYSEYKFIPSQVSGDMANTLDFWHLARNFTEAPNLNGNFVASGVPQDRIFAVNDGTDNCWIQIYNKVHAKRPMPKFGVPHI